MGVVLKKDILGPLIFLLSFVRDDIVGYDEDNTVSDPMYVNGILMLLQATVYWCLMGTGLLALMSLWFAAVFHLNDAHVKVPLIYFVFGILTFFIKSSLGAFFHYSNLLTNISYNWEEIPEYSPIDPTTKLRWYNASFQEPPRWIIWFSWVFAIYYMYREANKEYKNTVTVSEKVKEEPKPNTRTIQRIKHIKHRSS